MSFRILGPLEIQGQAGPVTPRGTRQRVALAVLLLRANTVVAVDDLIDCVWPDRAPATAREQVLTIVSGVRRLLGDHEQPTEHRLVMTRSPGYLARIQPGQLDARQFESLTQDAQRELADGRPSSAARALRAALELWRGDALADVPAPFAANEAQRLAELRLSTMERLIEVEFGLGRHREILPQLAGMVAQHPLRERLRGQLMVALHAVGRTAEALETYRVGRRLIVAELGLEPGAELRQIERMVLSDAGPDPADGPGAGPGANGTSRPFGSPGPSVRSTAPPASPARAPGQLPGSITDFVGRRAEIDDVTRQVRAQLDAAAGAGPSIVTIGGRPGAGKTALAVRAGHLLREAFPDGQLYIDLHGTRTAPTTPAAALGRMIAALGVPEVRVPTDLDGRVDLYRTLTADRRLLVVLDDAADAAQVRPLLPGGRQCGAVVTSRRELADLAGARRVRLDVLPDPDAIALLAATGGAERIAAERAAAARVVQLCDGLPLALRIAGSRLGTRGHWSVQHLADRLVDERHRLDELRIGDLDLRAGLAASLRGLGSGLGGAARRLAELNSRTFSAATAAAALDSPVASVDALIDRLMEWHLVRYAGRLGDGAPRYGFPELVRLYLRERSQDEVHPFGPPVRGGPWRPRREHPNGPRAAAVLGGA